MHVHWRIRLRLPLYPPSGRSVARSVGMDNGQRIGIEREGIGGRGRGRVTERWTSFLLGGRFSVRPFLEAIPGRRERERGKGLGDTIHTKVPLPPSHLHRKGSARIRQHNEYGAARNLTPLTCTGQYYIGTSKARAVSVCLSFLFLSFCTMFQRKKYTYVV